MARIGEHQPRYRLPEKENNRCPQRGEDEGAPQQRPPGDRNVVVTPVAMRFGDLPHANGAEPHGGNARASLHQIAKQAHQADACWTEQNGHDLHPDQADNDVGHRRGAHDG